MLVIKKQSLIDYSIEHQGKVVAWILKNHGFYTLRQDNFVLTFRRLIECKKWIKENSELLYIKDLI